MGVNSMGRQMIIGWLMSPAGAHPAGWTKFGDRPNPSSDFARYAAMAREAERAKLDFVFQADWPSVAPGPLEQTSRNAGYNVWFDPIPLTSALAAVTSEIGIVATGSTTYSEPYNLARNFASLDHISRGRAAWNIVTSRSPIASLNYGHTREVSHEERYRRAEEFVDVVLGLWDSYEDDAIVRDPERGLYFDPAKRHELAYVSEYFRVRGPLNMSRPPQGHPVLFQAGASDTGIELGARVGEVMFSVHPTIDLAQTYMRKLKDRAAAFGRSPDDLRVVTSIDVVVKKTAAEAEDAMAEMDARLHPDALKTIVSTDIEADISDLGIDDLVTLDRLPSRANSSKSADSLLRSWLEEKPMTVRELFHRFSRARSAVRAYGDPKQVADIMEEWFTSGATDGFMLLMQLESGIWDFGSLVVPELQRRGLFRTEYAGRTLRDHLGLPRPPHPSCVLVDEHA